MPDRDRQLDQAEEDIAAAVADALTATAEEFADAVADATELVAARFSVGRIARMWGRRVSGLVRRLLGVSEAAAGAAAQDLDSELPAGWDDLPGRYDDGRPLPAGIGRYVQTTEHLLRAVGDRLAEAARRELAAGLDAGEDIEQLRARLVEAFNREGAQLGPGREHRIAQTEATRAWNTATLAAARAAEGPDRPTVKQWITRRDSRVRDTHDDVSGQLRLLAEPFMVAGVPMDAPGDPTAPPALVINCRCRLAVAPSQRASAYESQVPPAAGFSNPRECSVEQPDSVVTAAGGHTGAMIALIPSREDARRLALNDRDAEPEHDLHLTLMYLGEAVDWDAEHRAELAGLIRARAPRGPVYARAFGANHWNADRDEPCWVWSVGDDPDRPEDALPLEAARAVAIGALEEMLRQPALPAEHTPWQPHVAAAYSRDDRLGALTDRLGPVRFDRIRVAFGGERWDVRLDDGPDPDELSAAQEVPPMTDEDTRPRPWHTPDDTGLAFENEETGDGRVFRPGALYWSAPGPWPMQYADEMLMAHQGAELAGAIQTISRDGDRIAGTGVLYPSRPAGADALATLEQGGPLGVSVDLDDVAVEFVDRTTTGEEAVVLFASLPSASMLRLDDGSWAVTSMVGADWTAAGVTMSRTATGVQLITGPGGRVSAAGVRAAFGAAGVLTAAAGDPDSDAGMVVHRESSGDLLMRVTRARVRGATLVSMPAYDKARIVLADRDEPARPPAGDDPLLAGAGPSEAHLRVVAYVKASPVAIGAREVAQALDMTMEAVRGHLARAAKAGRLVRMARGLYVGPTEEGPGDASENEDEGQAAALTELEASAWSAMREADPMPAAWFREPTPEELPPGSGGVHYADGRVYGWVAQAGEPHAGMPGKVTIESLGRIDTSHFLRARFPLDDGSVVRAGAFTMNVGHHRDGAECETASCQYDDTRTVAGIVTVGMNAGGMWFSGAAAPWMSEWDRRVFKACQPSYHMKKGSDGAWQLRAVLSVPVPGHSSPLVATAVCDRSNLAIAASASTPDNQPDTLPDTSGHPAGPGPDTSGHHLTEPADANAIATALLSSTPFLDVLLAAIDHRQEERNTARAEVERLAATISGTTTTKGEV